MNLLGITVVDNFINYTFGLIQSHRQKPLTGTFYSSICLLFYSNRPYCKIFHLTNRGRRHQQLVWSMDGFSPIAKAKKEMQSYNPLDMKYRVILGFLPNSFLTDFIRYLFFK